LSLVAFCLGCPSQPAAERRWTSCTCDYMTDRDQPGKVNVEVCGAAGPRLTDVAKSCALNSGVGVVIDCACEERATGACSDRDICRERDHP
jgi:hypothetical protein